MIIQDTKRLEEKGDQTMNTYPSCWYGTECNVDALIKERDDLRVEQEKLRIRVTVLEQAIETIYHHHCERGIIQTVCEEVMK